MNANVILRTNYKKKNGLYPLYLFTRIKGKQKMISLDISVNLENWNKKSSKCSPKEPDSYKKNMLIEKAIAKAKQIIYDFKIQDKNLTPEQFEELFTNGKPTTDFFAFMKIEIDLKAGSVSPGYYRQVLGEISKLKKFRPVLSIYDVDYSFLQKYEHYMRNDLHNQTNTITKTFKRIRTFLQIAVYKDIINVSPFKKFKLKNEPTDRVYLTRDEVLLIHKFINEGTTDQVLINVAKIFLFSCYTGLRVSDLKQLSWNHIQNNEIKLKSKKTKKYQTIPLNQKAIDLLPENNNIDYYVFKLNPDFNKYIKLIASRAGINKDFSFHSGRHTFATLCLTLDIPIEVVQEYLAHTDIRTTKIYARIVDDNKKKHMIKFDSL